MNKKNNSVLFRRGKLVKIMSLILALSIIVPMTGCGSNKAEDPSQPAGTTAPFSSPTPAPSVVEAEASPLPEVTPVSEPNNDQPDTADPTETPAPTIDPAAQAQAEAEERARAEEEARRQAEEDRIRAEQLNSFSMMYYLAITAEEIRTSRDNRLILDDIYTSLLNDINPGAVDEITQDHLKNLRDIIKSYILISTKRERLQFIYNQEKAAAIRSAVPNPLAILSMANSFDWKRLAMTVVYTAVNLLMCDKEVIEV